MEPLCPANKSVLINKARAGAFGSNLLILNDFLQASASG